MDQTTEMFVLEVINLNPGITVRQINMLHSFLKPTINATVQSLLRRGKLRKAEGDGPRNTKYYVVKPATLNMAQDDSETEGIAALRKERERYDSSKQRMNEIWSKAHDSLSEMLDSSDPDEMPGRLQQFNELMTEYAQAAKFVNSRKGIFG